MPLLPRRGPRAEPSPSARHHPPTHAVSEPGRLSLTPSRVAYSVAALPAGPALTPLGPTPALPSPPALASRGSRPTHAQILQLLLTGAQDNPLGKRQISWLSQHAMFQLWQSSSEESCAICQHPIARMEAVATTACIHHFHAICLSHGQSRALSSHGLCPTCRTPLSPLANLSLLP